MIDLVPGTVLPDHVVVAHNWADDSENRIHGDEIAEQYGFRGGLVPGVGVHAYMTRPALDAFGTEWLRSGFIHTKFVRPVYHGDRATVRSRVAADDARRIDLEVRDPDGGLCATGFASMPCLAAPPASADPADYPVRPKPAEGDRAPAGLADVREGMTLGTLELKLDLALAERTFVAHIGDDHPAYRMPGAALHPGLLAAQANFILRDNVVLGPWIHTESEIQNLGAMHDGETLSLRGRVGAAWEKRGHEYVSLDLAAFAANDRPVARILHTAIMKLRRSSSPGS